MPGGEARRALIEMVRFKALSDKQLVSEYCWDCHGDEVERGTVRDGVETRKEKASNIVLFKGREMEDGVRPVDKEETIGSHLR